MMQSTLPRLPGDVDPVQPGAAETNGFRVFPGYEDVGKGKDGGTGNMAASTTYGGMCVLEYVWIDADGITRCKTKTVNNKPETPDDCGLWVYDGSSTGQADGRDSDVYLVPRALFDDPVRGPPNMMVLCEAVCSNMDPAAGNYRAACFNVCNDYLEIDPWFGIEQEYTLMRKEGMGEVGTMCAGWNDDGSLPKPEGPYYCAVGTQNIPKGMRAFMDEHYAACLAAGVKIHGINAESFPGMGEYQIGPCPGAEIGDHCYIAKHLLLKIAEKYNFVVSFDAKPHAGDWSGAGLHCNFSTKQMRQEGGMDVMQKVCRAFGRVAKQHLRDFGKGNERRLDGKHRASDRKHFTYNTADRRASVRIPRPVGVTGKGYMEERRPAANACPYRVSAAIMETAGEVIGNMLAAKPNKARIG